MPTFVVDEDAARDAVLLIKSIAEQINHEPVAELRLSHEAVNELLAVANRVHRMENKDV